MKRILYFAVALSAAIVLLGSCNKKNKDYKNYTEADSVNYAIAYLNGSQMRSYMIGADTIDSKKVDEFVKAFTATFNLDEDKLAQKELELMGVNVRANFNNGLFGEESIPFNHELVAKTLTEIIDNDLEPMSEMDAQMLIVHFTSQLSDTTHTPSNETIDSLHTAIAVILASGLRQSEDITVGEAKENFLKGFKKVMDIDAIELKAATTGLDMAQQISVVDFIFDDPSIPIDKEIALVGVIDAIRGEKPVFASFPEAQQYLMRKQQEVSARLAQPEIEIGEAFLAENAAREGVVVTGTGLQYEVLTPAEGPKPTETSTVKVHYEGRLIDGTVFDSSIERGEPAEFPLNGVIAGWTEGLQLMSVGAKYRLYIPYQLGYGDRQQSNIPAYSTLIFDVELLEIVK